MPHAPATIRIQGFRALAGLLVLGALAHVVTLWPRVAELAGILESGGWIVGLAYAFSALTAVGACGLAALLWWKAAHRASGRALTLFLAFLAFFWGSLLRFVTITAGDGSVDVTLSFGGGWVSQAAVLSLTLLFAAFLRFSALFPTPLTKEHLPPGRLARFPVGRAFRAIRTAFLVPWVVWGFAAAVYLVMRFAPAVFMSGVDPEAAAQGQVPAGLQLGLAVSLLLGVLWIVSSMALGVRNLRDRYRAAPPEEKGTIQWVVAGFVLAWWMVVSSGGLVAVSVSNDSGALLVAAPLTLILAPLVIVVGAAVGVLYSGAVDPALALRRSTIYGVLGAVGLVAFAALENAASEAVEAWLDLPGFVGAAVAGGVVALSLVPLRRLLRRRLPVSTDPDDPST